MTQRDDGKVGLTPASWGGLLLTACMTIGAQVFLFHARVVTLENRSLAHEKRIDQLDERINDTRREILAELRALRQITQREIGQR